MRAITKISNLKLIESFAQVNYIKGFKYIDRAGQILNLFQKKDGAIKYQMSPQQLVIFAPNKNTQELKVSNFDVWLHFIDPNNLGEVERIILEEFTKILPTIEVEEVKRVGWRNFYILELSDDFQKNKFEKILETNGSKISNLSMTKEIKGVKAIFNIGLVIKNDKSKKPAILFDIDLFIKEEIRGEELKKNFGLLRDSFMSDDILKPINAIIKKI